MSVPGEPPLKPETTGLVIVEGKHETYAFFGRFGASVQVLSCDGKEKLVAFLQRLGKTSGFADQVTRVVVLLDNDSDPTGTESAAKHAFLHSGFKELCRFIPVPGLNEKGMFEDLLLPQNLTDAEHACIDKFFECALSASKNARTPNGKARMQVWLATRKPGRMLGSAIQENIVDTNGARFNQLIERIRADLRD